MARSASVEDDRRNVFAERDRILDLLRRRRRTCENDGQRKKQD
jgi:hypothetical protein